MNFVELLLKVLRDGIDQAEGDWRLQAARRHQRRRRQDIAVQARVPVHFRVGDPRPPAPGGHLQQRQHSQRESPYSIVDIHRHNVYMTRCSQVVQVQRSDAYIENVRDLYVQPGGYNDAVYSFCSAVWIHFQYY